MTTDRFANIVSRLGAGTSPNTEDIHWLVTRLTEAREAAAELHNFLTVMNTDALNAMIAAAASEEYVLADRWHLLELSCTEALRVLTAVQRGLPFGEARIFSVGTDYLRAQEEKAAALAAAKAEASREASGSVNTETSKE